MKRIQSLLLVVVITGALFASLMVIPAVSLPESPTGYDYTRANDNITDPWQTPTPTATPPPTQERTTNQTTFSVQFGPEAKGVYEYPVTVRFERVAGSNWTMVSTHQVSKDERFAPPLTVDKRYRITIEDATGHERMMAAYVHGGTADHHTIVIRPYISDDFSNRQ